MLKRPSLYTLLGKKIKHIVTVTNVGHPPDQLFLVFGDDTYFEFFGDNIEVAARLYPGGVEAVLHYVRDSGSEITQFVEGEEPPKEK
ncbi:hypothetical protein ANRL2_03481 [Anaerolineae bacterium]|nr:hypothetical protein ANRL2_03481 [Anaerolineae bacterium]